MVRLLFLIIPVAEFRLSGGRASARSAGCRQERACIQAAADTIQEAVADDPALHLRMHVGLQGC